MLQQILIFTRTGFVLVNSTFSENLSTTKLIDYVLSQSRFSKGADSSRDFLQLHDRVCWCDYAKEGLFFVIVAQNSSDEAVSRRVLRLVTKVFLEEYDVDKSDYTVFVRDIVPALKNIEALTTHKMQLIEDDSHFTGTHSTDPRFVTLPSLEQPVAREAAHAVGLSQHLGYTKSLLEAGWLQKVLNFRQKSIDETSLRPFALSLKHKLVQKNVTSEIADILVDKVLKDLVGRDIGNFESIDEVVSAAFAQAVLDVFSTPSEVDILRDIQRARDSMRPYVIALVGVNGVGKSTSLSKLVYWFNQQNISVLVAACDTFRAGAVEQLRTHCQRLGCALYERGYEKDPAAVAQQAIQQAKRQGTQVVMIDTAGRMQDNEPLMCALAKLVNVNSPDLTLFVGEALVGNDGVSQILQFERRLQDLVQNRSKVIDGIFLSKFDTIDDKVGTALSLVYSSSIPIIFVGIGQTYGDICKFQAESIASLLLR